MALNFESEDRFLYMQKEAPFIARDRAMDQKYRYEGCEEEFNDFCHDDQSPHLYENMNVGDNVLADLPCSGCPSLEAHAEGNCIIKYGVPNYEQFALYYLEGALNQYDEFLNLAEQQYISEARQLHADALELSPDLTPELIETLKTAKVVDPKYQKSMEMIKLAEGIPLVAEERKAFFLNKTEIALNEKYKIAKYNLEFKNRLYILRQCMEGTIDETVRRRVMDSAFPPGDRQ